VCVWFARNNAERAREHAATVFVTPRAKTCKTAAKIAVLILPTRPERRLNLETVDAVRLSAKTHARVLKIAVRWATRWARALKVSVVMASVAQRRAKRFVMGPQVVAIAKATPRILRTTASAASLPEKIPVTRLARIAPQL